MTDTIKLAAKGVILAKIQSGGIGVDPVPDPGTDALLVEDVKIEPVFKTIEQNHFVPYMGAKQSIIIGETVKVSFKTKFRGSGTAGVAGKLDPFYRACNYTATPGSTPTRIDYIPNSLLDSGELFTLYAYKDGTLRKILDCKTSKAILIAKAGDPGDIEWECTGIYDGLADIATPEPDFSAELAIVPPRFISAALTLDGDSIVIENLKVDFGPVVGRRPDANAATGILQYFQKNRTVTVNLDPEVVAVATRDWEAEMLAGSLLAFTATFGASAGNKIVLTASQLQVMELKDAEREGIWTQDLTLKAIPTSAGNDEFIHSFQ